MIHNTARRIQPRVSLPSKLRRMQRFAQRPHTFSSGSRKPAWGDIAYHFIIGEDGTLAEGRNLSYAGDTNTEYAPNGHILVVLEGHFAHELPTEAQLQTLNSTVLWLARTWSIPADQISGHKDHSRKTGCPGANLYSRLPDLRNFVAERMERD